MKELWPHLLVLVMVGQVGISVGELPPPERSYKILMLLPVSSKSHRNVFMPVAEALADRGHKIVMLSNNKKPSTHRNIHEVYHSLTEFNTDDYNMFETRGDPSLGLSRFIELLPEVARKLYTVPKVREIYEKRKEFDLIVINHVFNEVIYPFVHELPFITISTPGFDYRQSAVMGNLANPAYVQVLVGWADTSRTLGRLTNAFVHIAMAFFWRNWAVVPLIQNEITTLFPDLPPLLEIERNLSLTLMNSHFSTDMAVIPLLPSQIEVGGMHCRPGKPLPENLNSWIEGAGSAGVIYFSLGSVARGDNMPVQYRKMFIEAFKKIKQRVIWKFEGDLEDVPENVMLNKWLPQQDILAHPNVKLFITHGGGLSMQEACYHGIPLLALPIFGDQPMNGERIVKHGIGLSLVWEELTVDLIMEYLQEIINNPEYKENTGVISKYFRDQITTPTDRAVFWTEYVIRHKGAPKLRSPAAELSWVKFLLLDVLVVLLLILMVVLFILRWVLRKIFCKIFGTSSKKAKRE